MSVAQSIRQNTRKNEGCVAAVEPIGDGLARIRATARQPILQWRPGQAVGVIVDPTGDTMRDRWRHYTVRRTDADTGEFELVVVDRGPESPAGRWVDSLRPGATFTFMGPGGRPTLGEDASAYVFVGDRTSVASIAAMVERLLAVGGSALIDVVIGTPEPERADLTLGERNTERLRIRWLPADDANDLRTRLPAALPTSLHAGTQAYVTGEMKMMQGARQALQRAGLNRRSIHSHAHWTPGRRGM
ncbi:MAG: siderophore-interacting protein [Actinomycetota bacterium]